MALSNAVISYDVSDQVGTDFDIRRTKIWVSTNIADGTVIDTVGNAIRVDTGQGTLAADGTGSVTVWTPGTGSNPDSWQTYVHLDYASPMDRTRKRRTFGPFTVTTSANLADLVEEQEVPAEYLTAITAALDAYADSAAAASTSAAASATSAAASAAAAKVISDIATPDALVAALAANEASAIFGAISEGFAHVITPQAYGAVGDGVADDTAELNAAIAAAVASGTYRSTVLYIPAGVYKTSAQVDFGSLTVIGEAFAAGSAGVVPFSAASWTSLTTFGTTILKSTMTSGTAFLRAGYSVLENLVLLGPGTGTSTGLGVSALGVHMHTKNLIVLNWDVGVQLDSCYFNTNDGFKAQSCDVGVLMSGDASNCNAWRGGEFRDNRIGFECIGTGSSLTGGQSNKFDTVTFQYNTEAGFHLHGNGSSGNVFDNCWFEAPAATKLLHIGAGADGTVLDKCSFGATAPALIDANRCTVSYPTLFACPLTNTGIGNAFLGRYPSPGTLTDTGAQTSLADPYTMTKVGKDLHVNGVFSGGSPLCGQKDSTGSITLTGTAADVTGTSLTLNPTVAGTFIVDATFDFNTLTTADTVVAGIHVDGALAAPQIAANLNASRIPLSRSVAVHVAAGSRTIKIQAYRVGTAVNITTNAVHTGYSYRFIPD